MKRLKSVSACRTQGCRYEAHSGGLWPPEELGEVTPPLPAQGAHGGEEQQTPLRKRPPFSEGKGRNACWERVSLPEWGCVTRSSRGAAWGPSRRDGNRRRARRRRAHTPTRVPAPTCLLLHVVPQQVAAGEVLHAEVLDNPSGDGAFPGARRPHDDGAQQRPHHHAVPAVPAVPAAPAAGAQGRGRIAAGAPPSQGAPPRPAGRPGPVLPGNGSGSFSGCQSGAGRKDPLHFEASFIRLIDKVTNGSRIEINQTGTTLYYQPGLLYGGLLEHDCSPSRGIGYYLESLLCLAPFMKHPLKIVLRGVTNDQVDPSVDVLKATALPLLKKFGIDGESLEIKINRRGMPPKGGGEILFSCPVRKVLQPVQFTDPGKIKRIRGTAYSVRVSPQMANRMVESARGILNKFLPDIYIYTDHMKGVNSGKSPGFGLCLTAETINGTVLSAELASNPQGQGAAVLPEELGQNCAKLLLEEVYRGGCVDSTNQSLALLLMTLGQRDVSKVLLGPLSPYTVEFLRHLRSFFQIMFKIETKTTEEEHMGGEKVLMTCVGIGFCNLSKTIR